MGLGSSQNGLNGLILNWCTSGYWFTLAQSLGFPLCICVFCTFRCGLLVGLQSFLFFSLALAMCFSFYLFTYSLVDFLRVSMSNPYKPIFEL